MTFIVKTQHLPNHPIEVLTEVESYQLARQVSQLEALSPIDDPGTYLIWIEDEYQKKLCVFSPVDPSHPMYEYNPITQSQEEPPCQTTPSH